MSVEYADEPCGFCFHRYAYELEYRCVACDRPVCPICAVEVRATAEVFCTECGPAEEHGIAPAAGAA